MQWGAPSVKLYVVSDLHFEASPSWDFPLALPTFDVAVIAGDLDRPLERAVERIATTRCFSGKPVILVPGNHEFDGSIFQDALASGAERAAAIPGVHLLHRRAAIVAGVRFIGATLWTDYEFGREHPGQHDPRRPGNARP